MMRKKLLKKLIVSLITAAALVFAAVYFLIPHKKMAPPTMPPTTVHVQTVKSYSFPLTASALGQVTAPKTIMLKAKAAGTVTAIYFKEGEIVKKGQPLLRIDDSTQKANLAEMQANYDNLKTQYKRYIQLQKNYPGAASQDTISQTLEKMKAAKAEVDATKGTLNNTLIRAPFSGTIGRLQATANTLSIGGQTQSQATQLAIGTQLSVGSPIAILSNTKDVLVQYQIPQIDSRYLKPGLTVMVTSAAYPNQVFEGTVIAISPIVYENSQTYALIARINNSEMDLKPGMKVFVTQTLVQDHKVLAVPGISLVPSLDGYSVYMIENSKVKAVPVVIEQRHGEFVGIQSGLKAGDRVITEGVGKVQPGTHVVVSKS